MIVRRLVSVANAVILVVIIGLFFSSDSKATADIVAIYPSPQSPPSGIEATETLTMTPQVYLPLVCRNFPPVIQVPEDKYLFVEYWTHSVLGANCEGLCIDCSTYYFDPQNGVLNIYPSDLSLVLTDNEIGYIGSGENLGGVGGGACSDLTKTQQLPLTVYGAGTDVTLRYADETGAITLEREGEVIALGSGEAWVSDEEIEAWDWNGEGCVVTRTHYITNYAFQDRDGIIYPP